MIPKTNEDCEDKESISNKKIYSTVLKSTGAMQKYPLDVCVGVSDGKFRQVSIINGIWVYNGGSHVKHIQNEFVSSLKAKVDKLIKKSKTKFNPNYILNNLFILIKGSLPSLEFTSQIKDCINDPIEKFSEYKFKPKDWVAIWKMLEPHIMSLFLDKYKDKKKTQVSRGVINVPKCIDAKYAGNKSKSKNVSMILCEGDSAKGTVHTGIVDKSTKLDYNWYGSFSIQGVPMNARKEVNEFIDTKTKESTLIRSSRLQKNERLTSLVKVLGLDYGKKYDMDDLGNDEFKTLRYSCVICAVDQDDDGKGNIFGLILNFFELFWPSLVLPGRQYIRRFNTPIIRLYPKNTKKFVEEFGSMQMYHAFVKSNYITEDKLTKDYSIKYFKGLGSHKKQEVIHMFKNFEKMIYYYESDVNTNKKLNAYFGNDTALRKIELSTPVDCIESNGPIITITEQTDTDLKLYQRDNIKRKLPSSVDGQVPSRRKIIYTARFVFGASNKEMKVNAFVNETSKRTNYHHGESSLAQTTTKMAQDFPGSRHLPFLRPRGQFGTRSNGGKDSADPRYTYTQLNKRLCDAIFPKDDDFLLKYVFDDGERCEPENFVPIIPLAIMEHMELPATGWKVKLWAREWKSVFKNVRNLISGKIKKATAMPIWMKDNIGDIRTYNDKEYSVGKYIYNSIKKTIIITELPLKVYSSGFIGDTSSDDKKYLCNKPQFKKMPDDYTNDDEVKITFYLTDTGYDEIKKSYGNSTFDPIEDFMNLKVSIDENINMIEQNGKVKEYKNYQSVVDDWYIIRKSLYEDRIDRHIILTNLMIKYLENIVKFTKNHQDYNITPKTKRDGVDDILRNKQYDTFNHTLLLNPKYTKISELHDMIINNEPGTSYDYLINLRYSDMIEDACKKRDEDLKKLYNKLKDLEIDTGSIDMIKGGHTWINELNILEQTISEGVKKGWDYGDDIVKFR
jgi:DNA topoisomerase-2